MIIKRERVRLEAAGSAPSGAGHGDAEPLRRHAPGARVHGRAHGPATVRPIELEGEIRGFELTCACGDVSVVELVLEEPPVPGPSEHEETR